jgi:hypothetical protein
VSSGLSDGRTSRDREICLAALGREPGDAGIKNGGALGIRLSQSRRFEIRVEVEVEVEGEGVFDEILRRQYVSS